MFKALLKISIIVLFSFILNISSNAEVVNKITINGNERISDDYIMLFSEISLNQTLNNKLINKALKKIYNTGFFKDVDINFNEGTLEINLIENPIIQSTNIKGIKAKKISEPLFDLIQSKSRSPLSKNKISSDERIILNYLKERGYSFSKVVAYTENISNNLVDLTFEVELGNKAKISQINFLGDKKFKNAKLKSIILSEEYKFWKILSGKKFLNNNMIEYDIRLLENFYKNNGFYNIQIDSSFAKYLNEENFELIYNIQAGEKFFFDKIELNLPIDYDVDNFSALEKLFKKLNGKPYSINSITKILKEIDKITLNKQYEFLQSSIEENITGSKINLKFNISETEKSYIERIDIMGNDITIESVIRNELAADEGDAFNELLHNKSINNLKALNFFKNVKSEVNDGSDQNLKVITINVEEKPTGEISAGAGIGTSGETFAFSVSENNFLGRGVEFSTNMEISRDSLKGKLSMTNPNYLGTGKSISGNLESSVTDNLTDLGYKTKKTGFNIGSGMEIYENLIFSRGMSTFFENIETDASASVNMKKQKGNYFDNYINYSLDYDMRNQKFQTSDGFRSKFYQQIPVISENNSLTNIYDFKYFQEWLGDNIYSLSFYGSTVNSITGDNVKLSERLFVPSRKLRGFEVGKVGPKDGDDYIGGNYSSAINFNTTLNQILPNAQNFDLIFFIDAANIWSVDYDKSLSSSDTIRSSTGISFDWLTPIGPLSFSFAHPITKNTNDKTETFRFNLGTTF